MTIQSVLDVKDDNPPPRGAGPLFNRSILILTPQRALKFTATNAERHYIWLTSLSFLAHSNQAIPETLALPQPKPLLEQYELPKPRVRRPIRDSIRLTKAKTAAPVIKSDPIMPEPPPVDSAPPNIPTYRPPLPDGISLPTHVRDMSRDAAEPPHVPRFSERANPVAVHGRKRSNTGGHVPPPLSFRGFSGPAGGGHGSYHAPTNSTAGNSVGTAGSSDIYSNAGASGITAASSPMTWATTTGTGGGPGSSIRSSEASSRPSGGPVMMNGGGNFFDAIGTVRMEAFISPLSFSSRFEEATAAPYEYDDFRRVTRRRSREQYHRRRQSRSRQRDSYQSRGTRTTATDEMDADWYLRDDPFRGF